MKVFDFRQKFSSIFVQLFSLNFRQIFFLIVGPIKFSNFVKYIDNLLIFLNVSVEYLNVYLKFRPLFFLISLPKQNSLMILNNTKGFLDF